MLRWRMDDEDVAYPMYEVIRKNRGELRGAPGFFNICVHKGLQTNTPDDPDDERPENGSPADVPKAARDWPEFNFIIYHAAWAPTFYGWYTLQDIKNNTLRNGVPDIKWVTQMAQDCAHLPNVYCEMGSTFGALVTTFPTVCAHLIGQLMKYWGSSRIVFGTDSLWYGSPQWQIEALWRYQIPEAIASKWGYPQLTMDDKRKILGLNSARLYKLKPHAPPTPSGLYKPVPANFEAMIPDVAAADLARRSRLQGLRVPARRQVHQAARRLRRRGRPAREPALGLDPARMSGCLSRRAFVGAAASLAAVARAGAQTATVPVEVSYGILSPSASGWPLVLAESQGFYRDEGLKVTIVNNGSAPGVTNALATGATQMADNGTDSYIVAIGHGLPIKMIAPQCAINPYSLIVSPNVSSWADLKGKSIVLGTKQDVTAIVFAAMAAAQKLKLEDFSIVTAGASSARYAALTSGNVAGALLSQPFDLLAQSKGMRVLATAHDTFRDWALACTAVNVNWAIANRETVVKVLRAERRAIRFGYANKATSVAALVEATHVDPAIAQSALGPALWPLEGLRPESAR